VHDAPQLRATLRNRDTDLGRILLRAREPFDADDGVLLDELATRAAVAIDNAQLYAREHRVAVTLQEAMLPAILPRVEGVAFDAVYYPGATEAAIGGDWYDAIEVGDGRVVVSIGDVTGRGLTAAVIMGRMRQAIESLATYESDPVRLLDAADLVLRRAHPDAIVTALVGVVDPADRTFTYATAGHPTPLVRDGAGTVIALPGRGLPLGLRDGHASPATTVVVPRSALVTMYTDGLVESTRDILEGERRLRTALADAALAGQDAPAAALVAHVLDEGVRDDVAVLTMRLTAAADADADWTMRWRFDPREALRTRDVRDNVLAALRARTETLDAAAAALIFGELTANAIRHAPGPIDVELRWEAGGAPVLIVYDEGAGCACTGDLALPRDDAESGRGLFLVSRLAREFSLARRPDRGTIARAVLRAG
jgi:serine phosphatase RsbU (regulator of sigma subunit)/anti-sigma regulatory factor (Ser/Thr protein kinase)